MKYDVAGLIAFPPLLVWGFWTSSATAAPSLHSRSDSHAGVRTTD